MKFESVYAVVLSANDVVANVLVVDINEDGYLPQYFAQVSLPNEARYFRKKAGDKSMFQRGDVILIECNTKNIARNFTEKDIDELENTFLDYADESEHKLIQDNFTVEKVFDKYWTTVEKDGKSIQTQ